MTRLVPTLALAVTSLWSASCTATANGPQKVSGYDRMGKFREASLLPEGTMCTEIFTEGEQYAADCKNAGHEVHRIACHEYLCAVKLRARK